LPQYYLALTERKEEEKEDRVSEIQEARTEKKGNNDSHIEAHTGIGL